MKKTIITISREFGSGGRTIGHQVAEKLGYAYYDKELIKSVAEKTGFDPNYVEEYGEYSPGKSLLSLLSSYTGAHGTMGGMSVYDFLYVVQRKAILEVEGGLVYCSPWDCKESDRTEQLNNHNIVMASAI